MGRTEETRQVRSLRWQAYASQQVLEARVGAQAVEKWVHIEKGEGVIMLLTGLFQPVQRLILLAETNINNGNEKRGDMPPL